MEQTQSNHAWVLIAVAILAFAFFLNARHGGESGEANTRYATRAQIVDDPETIERYAAGVQRAVEYSRIRTEMITDLEADSALTEARILGTHLEKVWIDGGWAIAEGRYAADNSALMLDNEHAAIDFHAILSRGLTGEWSVIEVRWGVSLPSPVGPEEI